MTHSQKQRFVDLLNKFIDDTDFMELMGLLPIYKHHKEIEYSLRGGKVNNSMKEVDVFDLLIFELEDIEKLKRGGK